MRPRPPLEKPQPEQFAAPTRILGIDYTGKAVWVKAFGHVSGITTTSKPEEAHLFHNPQEMRVVYRDVQKRRALRNVAVQYVRD